MSTRTLLLPLLLVAGCEDVSPTPPMTWPCPPGWAPTAVGGCGPAPLTCAAGGAAAESCLARAAPGGAAVGLRRLPGGGLGGAWPEPGAADGPPPAGWSPLRDRACPEGWARLDDGLCAPSDGDGCAAPLPGGGCLTGAFARCADGDFPAPADLPADASVAHVRAGAPAGGDGSAARPYASIRDAAAAPARARRWILVAAGTYREALPVTALNEPLTVVGACADRVVVVGAPVASEADASTFYALGAAGALDLRGLTVRGERVAVTARRGASVRASAVRFESNRRAAVLAADPGVRVALEDCLVRGTRPIEESSGLGVAVELGATLALRRVRVEGNANAGVSVIGHGRPTEASLDDVAVVGTARSAGGERGWGLLADRAAVAVSRSALAGNDGVELVARGEGASVTLEDVWLRGALDGGPPRDVGAQVQSGASLRGEGVVVEGHEGAGVGVGDPGSTLALAESAVRGQLAREGGPPGNGLEVFDGGRATLTRVAFADNPGASVVASGEGSSVTLDEALLEGSARAAAPGVHSGLQAQRGGRIDARRALVTGHSSHGAQASGEGSELALAASVVRDITGAREELGFGFGAVARSGGLVRATGVAFDRCAGVAVAAGGDGARLALDGCAVRGTRPIADGLWGHGVEVNTGAARAEVTRSLVESSVEAAVDVATEGASATLTDVWVVGVRPGARGLGFGVAALRGARVTASRLAVVDAAGAALHTDRLDGDPGAAVRGDDLYVWGVRPSTVGVAAGDPPRTPTGPSIACGARVARGDRFEASRFVFGDGSAGFCNEGEVRLADGVIARQDDLGVAGPGVPTDATRVERVRAVDVARAAVTRQPGLPTGANLGQPTLPEEEIATDASRPH